MRRPVDPECDVGHIDLLYWCQSLYGLNVDLNLNGLATAAESDTLDGSHVAIVAPPRQRNVGVGRHDVVGWIEVEPAGARKKHRYPRMRSLGALDVTTAAHVSTHITRGEPLRPQHTDHDVREILADSTTVAQYLFEGNINRC